MDIDIWRVGGYNNTNVRIIEMKDIDNLREIIKDANQLFDEIKTFLKGPWSDDASLVLFLRKYYDDVKFISSGYEEFKINQIIKDTLVVQQEVLKRVVETNKDNFEFNIKKPEETLNELTNGTNILDFHVYFDAYKKCCEDDKVHTENLQNLVLEYLEYSDDFAAVCTNMSNTTNIGDDIEITVGEEDEKDILAFGADNEKINLFLASNYQANLEVDAEFYVLGETFSEEFPYVNENTGNTDSSERVTSNDIQENEGR